MGVTPYDHLGFAVRSSNVVRNVLIPRYYNPELDDRIAALKTRRRLVRLGDLIDSGVVALTAGHEVGKMAYGTGRIPFVRTSDLVNWEIRGDPKQGVSDAIYQEFRSKQSVAEDDVLFVRDGTYLIGNTAIVSRYDTPFLFQSHLVRMRVRHDDTIDPFLLFASLGTPLVRRQIRSKQFTADIIDTIGDRYRELLLPLPADAAEQSRIAASLRASIRERAELLQRLRFLPLWAEGIVPPEDFSRHPEDVETPSLGFTISSGVVGTGPLIPRFYSPRVEARIAELSRTHDFVSVGQLVADDRLTWTTGIEVGKLAYGGGGPPFVRTSDFSTWELKIDPKQTVTPETYALFGQKQDVQAHDVFVVRDGTYLVGSSAIVTEADGPLLFSGGIYKLRARGPLDPYLLLALLNTPVVRDQMRTKQFTRDVIDTLGKRLFDILLPFPKDPTLSNWIAAQARSAVTARIDLRSSIHACMLDLEGDEIALIEEAELASEPA